MREHIFKAKRLDNNEWVQGYYVVLKDSYKNRTSYRIYTGDAESEFVDYNETNFYAEWFEVYPNTICEFTGITDKNDKMIFEHDIIKFINWKGNFEQKEVIYDSEWNRFCVWVNGGSYGVNKHLSDDIEVIENVYE